MYWYIWWGISAVIMLITLFDAFVVSKLRYKRKRILTPNRMMILGTFVSAVVFLCPIYLEKLSDSVTAIQFLKAILISIQHSIRLFAFDGGYMDIVESVAHLDATVQTLYTGFGAFLYAFAPLLSFGVILSFFKNAAAYRRYLFSFWKHTHVFSELNERTLALAKSIMENDERSRKVRFIPASRVVFTDVLKMRSEDSIDLIEQAKEMGAVLFSRDLVSIKYLNRFSFRKVSFYLVSDAEEAKVYHAESIINEYGKKPNVRLYVFSNDIECKCFLDSYTNEEKSELAIKVIRVNDIRALVYHNLNDKGISLFENANLLEDGTREISVAVVGLGKYGLEVIKAMLWYCQIPGYRINITAFDQRGEIESIFRASCPSIELNKPMDVEGDMRYTFNIKNSVFGTETFFTELENIKDVTYVFVCLGSDNQNITAATEIRNRLARNGRTPDIETVVYDSSLKKRLNSVWADGKIKFIGDLDEFYSEKTVIDSELIKKGLEVHMRWDNSAEAENNYYMSDYNYCSSLAGALHRLLRRRIIEYKGDVAAFSFYHSKDSSLPESDVSIRRSVFEQMNDNESVKKLAEEMKSFADALYSKIAYIYYRKLTVEERAAVLGLLSDPKRKIKIELPMLSDTEAYIEGYEALLDEVNRDTDKTKAMRAIYDCIISLKTKGKNEEEKRRIVHSFEYSSQSEEMKRDIDKFVEEHIVCANEKTFDMQEYFKKAKYFASIEHVRWNAYMRTEGFLRSGITDKKCKLHYDLVPVDMLTVADCIKDI